MLSDNLVALYPGQQNTLWIFAQEGITKINGTDLTLTNYAYPRELRPLIIYGTIIEDPENIWFTTSKGLYRFNKFSDKLSCYTGEEGQGGLLRNICYSMVRDDEGALWINHLYPGIDRAMAIRKPVSSIIPHTGVIQNISSYYIPFADSQGRLWIGHRGAGLVRYSIGSGQVLNEDGRYFHLATKRATLSSNSIIDMFEDRTGTIWIGTENGLSEYVPEDDSFRRYLHSVITPVTVAPVYEDRQGCMWIGLGDRLAIFDRMTGRVEPVEIYTSDSVNYSWLWINQIYEDVSGNFWIATARKGLLKLNRDNLICEVYHADPGDPHSISCNNITALHEDRQGRFWAASEYGLNLLDRATGRFTTFGEKNGMTDEYIFHIGEDDNGGLWLCTRRGISKFNPDDSTIVNLDHEDGRVNNGFIFRVARSKTSELMFFGGPDGVDYFQPEKISPNPYVPPVYITGISVNNRPVHFDKPFMDMEEIIFPYSSNDFTIDFVAVNYTQSGKNQYAFMLRGFDEDWIWPGSNSEARYTNIDPGKYTFLVRGSNNDGIWNNEGSRLSVTIRPPWWRSNTAYIAYLALIISLLYSYIRLRTWKLVKEKEVLEKQVMDRTSELEIQKKEILAANDELEQQKEELKVINYELHTTLEKLQKAQAQLIISEKMAGLGELVAGVAHEISTPVGISITAASSLIGETEKIEELYRQDKISRTDFREYLASANQVANLVLSNMERTAALVQSFKQVSVDQSTEQKREFAVREYFNDIIGSLYPKIRDKKIRINLHCDEALKINSYPGAYAQILTNLITNSISHGFGNGPGVIEITVQSADRELIIIYRDDGKGIAPDVMPRIFDPFFTTDHASGTGLGLPIVYNLVTQKLMGSITCESGEGEGVVFTVTVPGE
jgi:signal transduction histidine kinase/streptogramin lyase